MGSEMVQRVLRIAKHQNSADALVVDISLRPPSKLPWILIKLNHHVVLKRLQYCRNRLYTEINQPKTVLEVNINTVIFQTTGKDRRLRCYKCGKLGYFQADC